MNSFLSEKYINKQYKFRKQTDTFFERVDYGAVYSGLINKVISFVNEHQLTNKTLWDCFVEQFIFQDDGKEERWRGEYFGKMMRGACFSYKVTKDEKLYIILHDAINKIIQTQDEDGRITTYKKEYEFKGWDMWVRKYVLLGMEYFLEICHDDEFKEKITNSLIKQADYIINHIGKEKGKITILDSSNIWGSINSATILEPFVKLYNITRDKKYLSFASYIVKSGGCKEQNLIELALSDNMYPYQCCVTKAYEMMSFFDGIAEYYSVTKEEIYKKAFLMFVDKIIETDYSIIGCAGCTHELFDHSSIRQTTSQDEVMQETCVTVTLMKIFTRALELTGDSKYADLVEKSYYNAFIGSINFNKNDELYWGKEFDFQFDYSPSKEFIKKIHGLTFDSYSPLYKNARNRKTGGYNLMRGNKSYGCCACIGSLGSATLPLYALMQQEKGIVINYYMGINTFMYSPNLQNININMETSYPYSKKIIIKIDLENEEEFEIKLRIPSYVSYATINNEKITSNGYYSLNRKWHHDVIELELFYDLKVVELNDKIAIVNGVITYAIDNRNEDINKKATNKILSYKISEKDFPCNNQIDVVFSNNETIRMIDFSSSGANWYQGKNKLTVWIDKE